MAAAGAVRAIAVRTGGVAQRCSRSRSELRTAEVWASAALHLGPPVDTGEGLLSGEHVLRLSVGVDPREWFRVKATVWEQPHSQLGPH